MDFPENEKKSLNFIESIIEEDIKENKNQGRVHLRFPPEPNGYLHIGHAKSICLNFGLASEYNGLCNLRFDDTNPEKEDIEYVESIMEDIKWLGFSWDGEPKFASDYFQQLYDWAVLLIKNGKAYVDEQPQELISSQRGVPTRPGIESPYRDRPIEESLDLFERMKNGEFDTGKMILRAKIDMSSPNMHMRDPIMYRILNQEHHRTGNQWCIYPMYDWAHGQSDFIEGITHSICTLEFEIHRPLYDWSLDQIVEGNYRPQQIEFARLNLSYTVMSKRKLLELVKENYVNGWDDPRMPTISGFRRRGYTPESIRKFADRIGVAKRDNVIDVSLLEFSVREHLNQIAPRRLGVIDPVKVIITNYPENKLEQLDLINNPNDENSGHRDVPFTREIFIERNDFMEDPPKKFFRLGPDREVRLIGAYIIKCEGFKKDDDGKIEEIYCSYDPDTKSGGSGAQRKVKGTIHWVSAEKAVTAEIRLYDRLFLDEDPGGHKEADFKQFLNPDSLKVITNAKLEPSVANFNIGDKMQFQRLGYFCVDLDSSNEKMIINRTVPLRDGWAKKR
ncbi:MAG: glutamine--tRNA ligase/YqeY domain fusion protein [Lentimicrobiaceae bacterium]|jgi:glutaminyl-tRNA synthetase|nr:glutamine--tRNA ligase/YqeY domain fusion protein [Lentimicrobiaceae bacterium]MCP4909342.1 glutamine--tRNA ligase/YqeY domain fusion protein [Bacteroidota bacterium]MBT3454513.1 glutamine--tRNA ligase/YqeY domain fusion protein [Lentimicrobiaceae bacterium]MBT3818107.1 glutamine--tRNA ligase/YqeY domain fusion protein [Lentimicrobiaceae bacterium]MBT4061474.1 glutamine--tRNA ligase/YqeY domain fusion protein [Lentimicrobiaceae bacterium]